MIQLVNTPKNNKCKRRKLNKESQKNKALATSEAKEEKQLYNGCHLEWYNVCIYKRIKVRITVLKTNLIKRGMSSFLRLVWEEFVHVPLGNIMRRNGNINLTNLKSFSKRRSKQLKAIIFKSSFQALVFFPFFLWEMIVWRWPVNRHTTISFLPSCCC